MPFWKDLLVDTNGSERDDAQGEDHKTHQDNVVVDGCDRRGTTEDIESETDCSCNKTLLDNSDGTNPCMPDCSSATTSSTGPSCKK